jgi:hypothetical protein
VGIFRKNEETAEIGFNMESTIYANGVKAGGFFGTLHFEIPYEDSRRLQLGQKIDIEFQPNSNFQDPPAFQDEMQEHFEKSGV